MAQAICEKPQAAVEDVVALKSDDRAAANGTPLKPQANGGGFSDTVKPNGNHSPPGEPKADTPSAPAEKKNRIQVSNTKKPLFFYLNLAKRYMKQHKDVELSALGMAIPTVVTIAEILKANGLAVEKRVLTSTVGSKDESKGRLVQKAKIEIVLERNHSAKDSEFNQVDEEVKEKEQ